MDMRAQWILRTALVFVMLTLILVAIGYLVGWVLGYGLVGLAVMSVLSVVICNYSYWFSKQSSQRAYRVRIVTEAEEPRLYNIVRKVADKAGLPMPEVGICNTEMPNAFATGRNPDNAAVVATTGILRILNDDELEGVIGHEMSHVKNRDILVMAVASTIAAILTFASRMVFFMGLSGGRGRNGNNGLILVVGIIMMIAVPIAALLMQMAISRSREFLADETGARITGKPRALATALRKLESGVASAPDDFGNDSAREGMWISEPKNKGLARRIFSTHPPTSERVERLEKIARAMEGGEVPAYRPDEDSSRIRLRFQRVHLTGSHFEISLTFESVEPFLISARTRVSRSWTSRARFAVSTASSFATTISPLSSPITQSPVRTLWPPTAISIPMPP